MAMIKNKKEIACSTEACRITDELFSNIIKKFTYKTELELRDYILSEIKKRKLLPSFPPIVTSGPRAGDEIHPQPTANKLRGFVIIDFGVVYKGYMSDMTRTVFVGKPTKRDRTLYARVLDTQIRSINYLVPGTRTSAPDIFARENLGDIAKYFIHTLGHGVGTRIHEAPKLWRKSKHYFRESMIVTVEPGIYIPKKLGIRIEDTILITSNGPLVLTHSTKKFLIL